MKNQHSQNRSQSSETASNEGSYSVDDMEFLDDLTHVRKRAGTYIGDLGTRGLHHLVHEVVDNSLDEAMAGFASQIDVVVDKDHSISISDNGRGIPVENDPRFDKSVLECVMTLLKYGGKFEDTAYSGGSGGLNGMGMKTVNFLSKWCVVQVRRDGKIFEQKYQVGVPSTKLIEIGQCEHTGTTVRFLPDSDLFGHLHFDNGTLATRLQNAAFLNQGIKISFEDRRNRSNTIYQYESGLSDWVKHYQTNQQPIHPSVIQINGSQDDVHVDIAFRYHLDSAEFVQCYANNIHTQEGGCHLTGFRTALTRTLMQKGKQLNFFKTDTPIPQDLREGLTAVISIRLNQPQFESQNKVKLTTAKAEKVVNAITGKFLSTFWEEHPEVAKAILAKACIAAQARRQAKSIKRKLMAKSNTISGIPGKLRDCNSNCPEDCEIYLVEGDSAGGSAEGGRVREFQAILPLRGKIINTFKATNEKVLAHEEVQAIIQALGIGVAPNIDIGKLRYDKIIVMSDADVDGSHIRTLLLSFFYLQMPQLITSGHVFIAQPPLFRIKNRRSNEYVQTDRELKLKLLQHGTENCSLRMNDSIEIKSDELFELCRKIESTTSVQQLELLSEYSGADSLNLQDLQLQIKTSTTIEEVTVQQLANQVRKKGEQGVHITRFKGLGEMNAEELRQTVLLPKQRKLMKVTLNDAQAAHQMFHLLMGSVVEPRRRFIEKYALDVRNLDI